MSASPPRDSVNEDPYETLKGGYHVALGLSMASFLFAARFMLASATAPGAWFRFFQCGAIGAAAAVLVDSRASPPRAAVVAVASTELGASAPRELADHPRNDFVIEVHDESAAASWYTARSPRTQESAHSGRFCHLRAASELCHGMRPSQVAAA